MILKGLAGAIVFGAAAFTFGALGCLPTPPAMPQMPTAAIPTAEIPQAPDVQVPEFQPPELQKPEGPDLPQPPVNKGNCCIRTGNQLKKKCGNAVSCCTDEFEDKGSCEDVKGFWFFSPEGCAGAC